MQSPVLRNLAKCNHILEGRIAFLCFEAGGERTTISLINFSASGRGCRVEKSLSRASSNNKASRCVTKSRTNERTSERPVFLPSFSPACHSSKFKTCLVQLSKSFMEIRNSVGRYSFIKPPLPWRRFSVFRHIPALIRAPFKVAFCLQFTSSKFQRRPTMRKQKWGGNF